MEWRHFCVIFLSFFFFKCVRKHRLFIQWRISHSLFLWKSFFFNLLHLVAFHVFYNLFFFFFFFWTFLNGNFWLKTDSIKNVIIGKMLNFIYFFLVSNLKKRWIFSSIPFFYTFLHHFFHFKYFIYKKEPKSFSIIRLEMLFLSNIFSYFFFFFSLLPLL